jgi:hypothetical protein
VLPQLLNSQSTQSGRQHALTATVTARESAAEHHSTEQAHAATHHRTPSKAHPAHSGPAIPPLLHVLLLLVSIACKTQPSWEVWAAG